MTNQQHAVDIIETYPGEKSVTTDDNGETVYFTLPEGTDERGTLTAELALDAEYGVTKDGLADNDRIEYRAEPFEWLRDE